MPLDSSRGPHTKCQHQPAPIAPPLLQVILKESLPGKQDSGKKELTLNGACRENIGTDMCVCWPSQERLASRQESLVVSGDLQEYETQIYVSLSTDEVDVLPSNNVPEWVTDAFKWLEA